MASNKIRDLLCDLNICDETAIESFYPQVRDRSDVAVLKCRKSGVIFLSGCEHVSLSQYEQKDDLKYWGEGDRARNLLVTKEDDERRAGQFKHAIEGKIWLDLGTGLGGVLDLLSPSAKETLAVEPQAGARRCLQDLGYKVSSSLEDIGRTDIDTTTLFHVLEHLIDPIETLRSVRDRMKKGGKIIVEVPHANDFLITALDCAAFKKFTFWSEHLILHTRESLRIFLEKAGFVNVAIEGFQRYPLANHLYWLAQGKPGGHSVWAYLKSEQMEEAYKSILAKNDLTDTIIATAEA